MKVHAALQRCLAGLALGSLLLALPGQAAPALPWQAFDTGFVQAQSKRKPVMVQVYADWCQECHHLQQTIAASPALSQRLRQDFVLVRLNLGSEARIRYQGQLLSEKELAGKLQATWPPMLLFYGPDGTLIGRRFGPATAAELEAMLNHVLAKSRG